jgi:hypothetical protein
MYICALISLKPVIMKKVFALMLVCGFAAAFTACGSKSTEEASEATEEAVESVEEAADEAVESVEEVADSVVQAVDSAATN